MSRYKNKIKFLQTLQVVLIVACVLALAGFAIMVNKPKVSKYNVKDECGPIGGSISHSIDDIDACKNACKAYCQSMKKEFHDSSFEQNIEICNTCTCYCKDL